MTVPLTSKQAHLLRVLNELILENEGRSPTIKELAMKSGLRHERSVRRQLDQLKEEGMVQKDEKTARSLSLTERARVELSLPVQLSQWGERRNTLIRKLNEMDPELAEWYEGGVRVLEQMQNRKRFALCSHSLREMITKFQGSDPEEAKEVKAVVEARAKREMGDVRKARISRNPSIDPQGQARIADELNSIYGELSAIAHAGKKVDERAFLKHIEDLDTLLLDYLFLDQPEAYRKIEEVVATGFKVASAKHIRMLIDRNADSRQYFFKIVGADWFDWLQENGFFENEGCVARYFTRIASQEPIKVMSWIERHFQLPRDHVYYGSEFLTAARNMPIDIGQRMVTKISSENWGIHLKDVFLSNAMIEYLGYLIENRVLGMAKSLLQNMIVVQQSEPEGEAPYQSTKTFFTIEKYTLSLAMEKLNAIPAEDLYPFVKVLIQKIAAFQTLDNQGGYDRSTIWCSRIMGGDEYGHIKSVLILAKQCVALLDRHLDVLANTSGASIPEAMERLISSRNNLPLVRRIMYHLGMHHFEEMRPMLASLIVDGVDSDRQYYEYRNLVKEKFHLLSSKVQYQFLKRIKDGPQKKKTDDLTWYWRLERLHLVYDSLSEADKAMYESQKARLGIKDDSSFDIETGVVTTSWVGPNEPEEMSDMAAHTVEEVIKFLIEWRPASSGGYERSSVEGLARKMMGNIPERPDEWSKALSKAKIPALHLPYLRSIFSGFEDSLKKGHPFEWEAVIDFAEWLVGKAKAGTLGEFPVEKDPDWPTRWEGVFQSLAHLLTTGMHHDGLNPPVELEEKIWEIVIFLAQHPEPNKAYEVENMPTHGGYHSISINTVRGEALHALFALVFWRDRKLSVAQKKKTGRITKIQKDFLETILHDGSIRTGTTWFVFGRYFPWLWAFDNAWAMTLAPLLFPDKEDDLFIAAWEGFLLNSVFLDLVPHIKPAYCKAIDLIFTGKQKGSREEFASGFAGHLALIYFAGADTELFNLFLSNGSTKAQRAEVVSLIGRSQIIHEERKGERLNLDLAKKFWTERLKYGDPEELLEFGWWVSSEFFDHDFLLDATFRTVEQTDGVIDNSHGVLKVISALSAEDPYMCGAILEKMVFIKPKQMANGTALFLHTDKEKMKNVIVNLQSSRDPLCKKMANRIIDRLMKLGFSEYRELALNDSVEDAGRAAASA